MIGKNINKKKVGRVAGEKSLELAWRARKKGNIMAMRRELIITIKSVGNAYERIMLTKRKVVTEREKVLARKDFKKIEQYNAKLRRIDNKINNLNEIRKLAVETAKDKRISLT